MPDRDGFLYSQEITKLIENHKNEIARLRIMRRNAKSYQANTNKYYDSIKAAARYKARQFEIPSHCIRHHWSYNDNDAEDVILIKKSDHIMLHALMIYDKETKYYRNKDTNELLNTRKKHIDYLILKKKMCKTGYTWYYNKEKNIYYRRVYKFKDDPCSRCFRSL